MPAVDRRPPPLRLGSVALATDLERFTLDERQLVGVLGRVLARRVHDAVVGDAQLADCF